MRFKALLSVILVSLLCAWGSSPVDEIRKGNELYAQEKYVAALDKYVQAAQIAPDNAIVHYNQGNALYKQGKFQEAMQTYLAALGSRSSVSAEAYYNLGNAAFRSGDLEKAIAAYKNSLRISPGDPEAKHNLEFALRELKKQQEQQSQQQNSEQQENSEQQSQSSEEQQSSPQNPDEEESESSDQQMDPQQSTPPQQQTSQKQSSQHTQEEMSEQDVDRMLESVRQNERRLQQQLLYRRLMQQKRVPLEKDW